MFQALSNDPFNFLCLPKELRLQVYEYLPTIVVRTLLHEERPFEVEDLCCDMSILRTSSLIYHEALPVITSSLCGNGIRFNVNIRLLQAVQKVDTVLLALDPTLSLHGRPFRSRRWYSWPTFNRDAFLERANRRRSHTAQVALHYRPKRLHREGYLEYLDLAIFTTDLRRLKWLDDRFSNFIVTINNHGKDKLLHDFLQLRVEGFADDALHRVEELKGTTWNDWIVEMPVGFGS